MSTTDSGSVTVDVSVSESDTHPTSSDSNGGGSDDSDMILSRRETILAGVLGAATLGFYSRSGNAVEGGGDFNVNDVEVLIPDGEVNKFSLGSESELGIQWDGLAPQDLLDIRVRIRPSGGRYETVAYTSKRVSAKSGDVVLTADELFGEDALDLTEHSQIDKEELSIQDREQSEINEFDYDVRLEISTYDDEISETIESSFNVRIGYAYGFGSEFGVNFGTPEPVEW